MYSLLIIFSFLVGAILGSFINCVVYRLSVGKSFLAGRSFCPKCQKQIKWYDNIPLVSFFLLRGRCRACQQKISWQYPIVEFVAGVLFVLVFLNSFSGLTAGVFMLSCSRALVLLRNWLFAVILLILFLYDFKYYLIPDIIVLPAIALALFINPAIAAAGNSSLNFLISQFLNFSISGLVAAGFFLALFVISKGKWIGGGDIRLGVLLGVMLGYPLIIVAFFLAYVAGAIIGIILILLGKKTMNSAVPFGTFLTAGAFIALLRGDWLIEKYLSLTF